MKPAPCSLAGTISGIGWRPSALHSLVVYENRVVGRQDRAAAVAENGFDALVGQHLDDDLGAGHLLAGERMGACAVRAA